MNNRVSLKKLFFCLEIKRTNVVTKTKTRNCIIRIETELDSVAISSYVSAATIIPTNIDPNHVHSKYFT